MEMMIPGMATTSVQTPVANVQAGAKGQAAFQQTLVQQIAGETSTESSSTQTGTVAMVAGKPGVQAINETSALAPSLEELMATIDGLIDQLDGTSEEAEAVTEHELDELTATLENLNALLALLGAPVVKLQAQSVQQASEGLEAISAQESSAQLKSSIQDALLQLQATLQQGSLKQLHGQAPYAMIAEQLQVLGAKLTGGQAQETQGTKDVSKVDVPDWLAALPSGVKETQTHLQRLSHQSVHPAFIQALTEQQVQSVEAASLQEGMSSGGDSQSPTQLPLIHADNVRDFASLLKGTSTPSAYVLADEFAETMEGLIVQKFDIKSISGGTEAKLILFPEHLGQVDIKISMQNGILTAVFQADNAMAKDMLENQMLQLRAALQAQGLNIEKLEVTQSSSASHLTNQQFSNGQQGGKQSGDRQGFRDGEIVTDTAFEQDMAEQAAIQGLGFGRSINETA
ncbi:flagellar hook-length control protein FliK [Paenibacillus sp. strain BS8-2]